MEGGITITFGGFKAYSEKEVIATWVEEAIAAHMGEFCNFVKNEPYGFGRFRSTVFVRVLGSGSRARENMWAFLRRWKNLEEDARTCEGKRIWARRTNSPEEQRRYVMFVSCRKVLVAIAGGLGLDHVGDLGVGTLVLSSSAGPIVAASFPSRTAEEMVWDFAKIAERGGPKVDLAEVRKRLDDEDRIFKPARS